MSPGCNAEVPPPDNPFRPSTQEPAMARWIIFSLSFFTFACATTSGPRPVNRKSVSTWAEMEQCAIESRENAVRANCAERYQAAELAGTVERVGVLFGKIDLNLVVD